MYDTSDKIMLKISINILLIFLSSYRSPGNVLKLYINTEA